MIPLRPEIASRHLDIHIHQITCIDCPMYERAVSKRRLALLRIVRLKKYIINPVSDRQCSQPG